MADVVRVRLLGGFDATAGDRRIPSGGWRLRKAKALVKLLALEPTHTLHCDQVIDVLWPALAPDAGRNNLHQAVYAVRRAFATLGVDAVRLLTLQDDMLVLGRDVPIVTDVDELQRAAREARAAGDHDRLVTVAAASAGELLPEDVYEPWRRAPASAFTEWRTQLVMEVVDIQLARGDADAAVVLLAPIVTADPMHEPAARAQMRALAAAGRRPEALLAYERLRTVLRDELGADPEPATRAVFRELLAAGAAATPAVVVPAQRGTGNLPAAVTTLIGRDRELAETRAMLARTRLLTLTGMGGVGKTTLAVELARRVAADYPGGAHLVELAALTDGRHVAPRIARTLHLDLPTDAPTAASIVTQLRDAHVLVVLDNCEHLLDACAHVVAELLRGCAGLRIVATSREPLRVEGEVSWRMPSLALPDPSRRPDQQELSGVASVELFVRRAAAAAPGFVLTDDNSAAVAEICYRLDGIPLALELAAACIPVLSPQQVAERLGDSLALLRRGDRAAITRQQTLEATLAWSHELLGTVEQQVFRRLSVFAGSFTLEAAEAVCGAGLGAADVLLALGRLVDTSLVVVDRRGDATRYRLLETVRQYAEAVLRESGEHDATQRRHCDWYLAFAVTRDPELQQVPSVLPASIDVEHDNLRAALRFALARRSNVALELVTALWRYWLARGNLAEGRLWLEAALAVSVEPSPTRARALAALAVFDVRRGNGDRLATLGAEAIATQRSLGDPAGLATALHDDAVLAYVRGVWDECLQRCLEVRDAAAGVAPELQTAADHLRGIVLLSRGELPAARNVLEGVLASLEEVPQTAPPFLRPLQLGFFVQLTGGVPRLYFEETVLLARLAGVELARGYVLCNLADLTRLAGDLDEALTFLHRAADRFAAIGDLDGEAFVAGRLGCLHRVRGEFSAGRTALNRSLELRRLIGDRRGVGLTQASLGLLAASEGDVVAGRGLVEEALATAADRQDVAARAALTMTLASVHADSGDYPAADRLLQAALPESRALPGHARSTAWAHAMHADVLEQLDRHDDASDAARQARRLFTALGAVDGQAHLRARARRLQSRR